MEKVVAKNQCKHCGQDFVLTDKDREFYGRAELPEPTWCPDCRVVRRMAWRNDRVFYKRKCSKTGEPIISIYSENTLFPVYHPSVWYGDEWDSMEYGMEVDLERPFMEQWRELMMKVPRLGIDIVNCENSFYCNYCGDDKNCYLDIAGEGNEDCYYNLFTKYSKDCADCTFVYNSELVYESINCYKCNNVRYSMYLENCSDCGFCFDLKGCRDCLFSSNLRQKQYYIFNKKHTKEEYFEKLEKLNLGSYKVLQDCIRRWKAMMKGAIHRDMYSLNSENCTGNNIKNSKNCHWVFNISDCEDCKFLYDVLEAKDCMDLSYSLYHPEMSCDLISTLSMKYCAYSMASHYCDHVYYSDQCNNSSDLFGCIGLNRKKYCILNKQYSKEEYEALKAKIVERMKRDGEWGEFFPMELSPFAYNETVAQEYFSLTKEEALKKGYRWKDPDPKEYMSASCEVADDISDVGDITSEVLACEETGKNYRITKQELGLYRKMGVPVPRKCPDARHVDRIGLRNPRKLWGRKCDMCSKEVLTSYAAGRSERVYCDGCYLAKN